MLAAQNRYSLDGIFTSKPHEIAEILYELGICKDIRENVCPKCEKKDWKHSCLVRCRKCRYSESVVAQDRDLFCKRIALRSAVGCLWLMCTLNLSPDQAGLILGLDSRTVREQWDAFRSWLCPLVEKMNEELTVGGPGMDVEIDEVAFRSAGLNTSVLWLRFIGMVRRGSSKIYIAKLPYRLSQGGQGGGGPLSLEELRSVMVTSTGKPRLECGSICHTDSAKAYKQLDQPEGPLYDGTLQGRQFSQFKLAHTNVRHKPPHPEFTKNFHVKFWNGREWDEKDVVGGTQKMDGFFSSFRRKVGRQAFNTVGPTPERADALEKQLNQKVRLFQLQFWFSGSDVFQIFGAVRRAERTESGSASLAALSVFQPMFKASAQPEQESQNAQGDQHISEEECSLQSALFDDE